MDRRCTPTLSFTRFDCLGLDLAQPVWCVWAVLLIFAATNAVNLTDGLDGLAAGSAIFAFIAPTWSSASGRSATRTYQVEHALDLAVVAAAMVGACAGFLWWNAAPAQIFMGDTGSLAIGAGLAALALITNTSCCCRSSAGSSWSETLSVILQVGELPALQATHLPHGADPPPLRAGGWPETTVIIRFWILAGLCTAVALGIFYADFVGHRGRSIDPAPGARARRHRAGRARGLVARGDGAVAVDDRPTDAAPGRCADVARGRPDRGARPGDRWRAARRAGRCRGAQPGGRRPPPASSQLAAAAGVPVLSEFDLAARWDDRPIVAITGTDGKTTVTDAHRAMLRASGRRAVAAGNTEVPLVAAIEDPSTDVFVVEASSFRLAALGAASAPASARG